RWAAECAIRRRADDHLSLVAGISGRQRQALAARGVATLEALGELDLPMTPRLDGASEGALARVRDQARIQLAGRRNGDNRYEPTALKRLMGRYATREAEVDDLLRRGVLVDLLRAVRQSLRAFVESYSIKKMEPFYGFTREIDLRDAGSSIVAFEQWLELGEGDRPASDHLEQIEKYNRDDVVSTLRLRDWLETLRVPLAAETGLDG